MTRLGWGASWRIARRDLHAGFRGLRLLFVCLFLGVMTLAVSDKGALDGSLTTTQGAVAELAGAMDEYVAEFTMTFPAEAYLATVTFAGDASSASGALVDNKGFTRVLAMTPRFTE